MSTTIAPGAAPTRAPRLPATRPRQPRLPGARRRRGSVLRPGNHVIVVFGATGDLAHRKLLPGLFHLAIPSAAFMPAVAMLGDAGLAGESRGHHREAAASRPATPARRCAPRGTPSTRSEPMPGRARPRELRAAGERSGQPAPRVLDLLAPQELQIARLAATKG